MTKIFHRILLGFALGALASGCVYRINIQQGNYLDQAAVEQVKAGMTRSQVRYLLGTPMVADSFNKERWDYIYEPDAIEILDGILMRYIEAQIFQGAVENVACEMAARMVAMKAATDNAGNLIDELQLIYNKARQAAITKELSEIVGGAAAV